MSEGQTHGGHTPHTPSILDQVRAQVNQLSPDEVKAQLLKIKEQKARQTEARKGKPHGPLSDEQKAKRKAYGEERRQRPEVKAKMREYHQRPEVKARMKAYHKQRQAKIAALLARAKELGIEAPEAA